MMHYSAQCPLRHPIVRHLVKAVVLGTLRSYSQEGSLDKVQKLLTITHLDCIQQAADVCMSVTWEQ